MCVFCGEWPWKCYQKVANLEKVLHEMFFKIYVEKNLYSDILSNIATSSHNNREVQINK